MISGAHPECEQREIEDAEGSLPRSRVLVRDANKIRIRTNVRKAIDLRGSRLVQGKTGPVDVLSGMCQQCGVQRDFEFDISPVFGKPDIGEFQAVCRDQELLWQMYIWSQLEIERVLRYLSSLAQSRDVASIEYIIDAARHLLRQGEE